MNLFNLCRSENMFCHFLDTTVPKIEPIGFYGCSTSEPTTQNVSTQYCDPELNEIDNVSTKN